MTYQSRWGWHPCDYKTYSHLKRLHGLYWQALRRYAEWQRWARKKPCNRVIREPIVDESGRKIGVRIVGTRPEPSLCPVFTSRIKEVRHYTAEGKHLVDPEAVERVAILDHGVPAAYQMARHPAPAPELVRPLLITTEEIQRLATAGSAPVIPMIEPLYFLEFRGSSRGSTWLMVQGPTPCS
jgi:hypothetical protein